MALDADLLALASQGRNFAALTTLGPDGTPSTHVMWVHADDEALLINSEVHRQKAKNLAHDPRATVTVWDAADPYRYIEARGHVVETITGPEAKASIDRLAKKYVDADEYPGTIESERVILRIAVDRVHKNGF